RDDRQAVDAGLEDDPLGAAAAAVDDVRTASRIAVVGGGLDRSDVEVGGRHTPTILAVQGPEPHGLAQLHTASMRSRSLPTHAAWSSARHCVSTMNGPQRTSTPNAAPCASLGVSGSNNSTFTRPNTSWSTTSTVNITGRFA